MGVRVTDREHVAIYDSVSGTAFGPVFNSDVQAWDFLQWIPTSEGDPREMNESRLMHLWDRFREETA
jgi:hypothetical protein